MWTGFTNIFSFPQGSCSFLPAILVPELHTPVCEKLCSRKLQLLSWQLSQEPPESSSPAQCQSCACVLALWVPAVCNSTTYTNLPKGLGWAFLPLMAVTRPMLLLGEVLYYWFSSVTLVRNLKCCQKSGVLSDLSVWGLGHMNSGISRSQKSMVWSDLDAWI